MGQHRFQKVDDQLREFVRPAMVHAADDGTAVVLFQEQSFVLHPGDWIVEISPGLYERLTDADFQKRFRKTMRDT